MRVSTRLLIVLMPVESWTLQGVSWPEIRAHLAERSDEECEAVAALYRDHGFLSEPDEEVVNLLVGQGYDTAKIMGYVEPSMRVGCAPPVLNGQPTGRTLNERQFTYLAESLALYVEARVRARSRVRPWRGRTRLSSAP